MHGSLSVSRYSCGTFFVKEKQMAKYSVDAETMLKTLDNFWSYDDLLHAAENLITANKSNEHK